MRKSIKIRSDKAMRYTAKQHTFVVCAYKESPFLRECVESLLKQEVCSKIIIATGTPNEYIKSVADEYNIKLYINEGEGGIANDWNFGYKVADTPLVTIAHQDDVYKKNYLKDALNLVNGARRPLIYFCNYSEMRNGEEIANNKLLAIKRLMLFPLRIKALQNRRFWKRRVLSLGNPVCCPSVLYVKDNLSYPVFSSGFRSDVDWEAWEKISKLKGCFVYNRNIGMSHRIHGESETSATIKDDVRIKEDYVMFRKFWNKTIADFLIRRYAKSEESNQV
jgi:glycosyltransferase involved in cell wall biosynthesis